MPLTPAQNCQRLIVLSENGHDTVMKRLRENFAVFWLCLLLALALAHPADASKKSKAPDANSTPREFAVGNFFSAAAAAAVLPSVDKRAGPSDAIGKMLVDPNPSFEQVRLIPSLDGTQRKAVGEFFNIYRSDVRVVREQLSEKRKAFKAKLAAEIAADPVPKEEEDPAILELIEQIKTKQEHFTALLQRLIRPEQLQELEQFKHGKVPAYAE